MPNFADILNKPAESIERPKPIPAGWYLFTIPQLPAQEEVGQKKTPAVVYKPRIVQPHENVDMEQVAAMGGVQGKEMRLTYYLTDESLYRYKEFLTDTLGLTGHSLGEMMNNSVNRQFLGEVSHKPSQDGTQIYAEIRATRAA